MRKDLTTSLLAIIVMTIFLGLVYPLAITGISQVAFPGKANGSKVSVNGKVVGSSLIAQSFSHPVLGKNGKPKLDSEEEEILVPDKAYFQPRPSATGYSGDVTYFGNAGPNSAEAREEVREYMKAYLHLEKPFDQVPDQRRHPSRRGHPVGLRRRPPHLRRPTRGSRRTGSPRCATSRSPRSKT